MPLNDHTLLLQLERTVETVQDEIEALDPESLADQDHTHDDLYAGRHDFLALRERVEYLEAGKGLEDLERRAEDAEDHLRDAVDLITKLAAQAQDFQARLEYLEARDKVLTSHVNNAERIVYELRAKSQ